MASPSHFFSSNQLPMNISQSDFRIFQRICQLNTNSFRNRVWKLSNAFLIRRSKALVNNEQNFSGSVKHLEYV